VEIVSVRARHADGQDWFTIIERCGDQISGLRAYRPRDPAGRVLWGSLETLPVGAIRMEPPDWPKPPPPSDIQVSTQIEIAKCAAAMEIVAVRRGKGASWFAVFERYKGNPGALVGLRYQASSTRFGGARWITEKLETVPADHLTTRLPTCEKPALPPAWMLGRSMRSTWGEVVYDPADGWHLARSYPQATAAPIVAYVQEQPAPPEPPPAKWWQFWRRP
jgi:hypothetical protein